MTKTLLIVDLQNDFLPGGSLPVANGNEILPIINKILPFFDHVIASQDWHPENHVSFARTHGKNEGESISLLGKKQQLWPVHCVQKSMGAKLSDLLNKSRIEYIVYKGKKASFDSYSIFFDEAGETTHLFEYLKDNNLFNLYFSGLTTEYCVKYSVLDALSLGFSVSVIVDAIAALDAKKGQKALKEMEKKGARLISSEEIF